MKNSLATLVATVVVTTFLFSGIIVAQETQTPPQPNVVIILVDDLGWADVACFGSKIYETPNIDQLAAGGMKFTSGYAACAVCSPTRAAIMTGRYPARLHLTNFIPVVRTHAMMQAGDKPELEYSQATAKKVGCPPVPFWMNLEEKTVAELLKEAGYTTCQIGKWHLGPHVSHGPRQQGFDESHGGCELGQPPSYFDPYKRNRAPESLWGGIPTLPPRTTGEYLTDRESDEACDFIRRSKDKPFFLYMAHYAVHTPIQAKPKLKDYYQKKIDAQKIKSKQKNATYAAMVHSVDESVGQIMKTLEKESLAENTLVIFTGDNGGLMGPTNNTPLRAGKGTPYEGGIREPTIITWPGKVRPATTSDVPVTSVDYLPTICEATGINLPKDHVIDGASIVPLLTNDGQWKERPVYWHFPHYRGYAPYSIIRNGPWKLIRFYTPVGHHHELYNLDEDLSEANDLAEKMPEKVKLLDTLLVNHLKATNAQLPKRVSSSTTSRK